MLSAHILFTIWKGFENALCFMFLLIILGKWTEVIHSVYNLYTDVYSSVWRVK